MSLIHKRKRNSLDTETVHGYARILATPYRNWKANNFEECIEPLFSEGKNGRGSLFTFFNMDFDARAILKYLPYDNLIELQDNNQTNYKNYDIFYIPKKIMNIGRNNKNKIYFYDISQFFNFKSLDESAKLYLNDTKVDSVKTQNLKNHQNDWPKETMERYINLNYNELANYCQYDAKLTLDLTNLLDTNLMELFNLQLSSYTSKAKIGAELTLKHLGGMWNYPKIRPDLPSYQYAEKSYHGGIFDTAIKGYFEDITEIDISSAYPAYMVDMPHWANGNFYHIESESEILSTDKYGWVLAEFDCYMIPYHTKNLPYYVTSRYGNDEKIQIIKDHSTILYPQGNRIQYITLNEYQFLKRHKFNVNLIDGYIWRHNPKKKQYPNPFGWIKEVYELKSKFGRKDYKRDLTKIAMNGMYGKTAQRNGRHEFQNFFYSSNITAMTRTQMNDFSLNNNLENRRINTATDGSIFKGTFKLSQNEQIGGLGGWDIDHWDSGLIIGNGIYQLNRSPVNDNPGKRKTKLRSFEKNTEIDLIHFLRQHPKDSKIIPPLQNNSRHSKGINNITQRFNPVTLHMGTKWEKYTQDDINVFKPNRKIIDLNNDRTKKWPTELKTFDDLLNNEFVGKRYTLEEVYVFEDNPEIWKLLHTGQKTIEDFI